MTPVILTYHHVARPPGGHVSDNLFVTPEDFSWQMEFLKKEKFTVITLDQLRDDLLGRKKAPGRSVVITFDDGFYDNYQNAAPVLKKYGFPAVIFMVSREIRDEGEPATFNNPEAYLSLRELRELKNNGIEIGSHACSHRRLAEIPLEEAEREITESKSFLEKQLNCPIKWFSYPFGSFTENLADFVRKAGYLGAVSVIRDNRQRPEQLYYLPRVMVMNDAGIFRFRYYFSRLYHVLHKRKNRRRWGKYA